MINESSTKEEVLATVKEDGYALRHASEGLRNDREVVLVAVQNSGLALNYASEELQGDREVVLEAVEENCYALEFACEELRSDKEVVMAMVKRFGPSGSLRYALADLMYDRDVIDCAFGIKND